MSLKTQLLRDIAKAAASLPSDASAEKLALAIAGPDVKVVPLRRVKGNQYEAAHLSGAWNRDPWDLAAADERAVRRNFKDTKADAVGITLTDGSQHLLDPDTRAVVRFVQYINGSLRG